LSDKTHHKCQYTLLSSSPFSARLFLKIGISL
jgi:hypothetical protein